jgi:adenosylhomocysteine nucleosidase
LFVTSDPAEFSGVMRRFPVEPLDWPVDYAGRVVDGGRRWFLVANGAGPALAAAALETARERERIDAIVSTGYCGALDPELRLGAVVVGTRILSGSLEFPAATPLDAGAAHHGAVACEDRVIQTAEQKRALREQTGAAAVDMESHALAAEAALMDAPFYCVRAVTDTATEDLRFDFNAVRDAEGRIRRDRIVASAMRRPLAHVPELIRLAKRSRRASEQLGEYLASCRF